MCLIVQQKIKGREEEGKKFESYVNEITWKYTTLYYISA